MYVDRRCIMLNDIYAANLGDDMCQVYVRTEPAQWYDNKWYTFLYVLAVFTEDGSEDLSLNIDDEVFKDISQDIIECLAHEGNVSISAAKAQTRVLNELPSNSL